MAGISAHDRFGGINWLWFVYMLGYEIVWVVLARILLVELLFPDRGGKSWLRRAWSRRGLNDLHRRFFGPLDALDADRCAAEHSRCPSTICRPARWLSQRLCPSCSRRFRTRCRPGQPLRLQAHVERRGLRSLRSARWDFDCPGGVIVLVFAPQAGLPLVMPLLAACVSAAVTCVVLVRWSNAAEWNESHRWALAFERCLPPGSRASGEPAPAAHRSDREDCHECGGRHLHAAAARCDGQRAVPASCERAG
jgi:hypothetical protein